jgi:LmbE family N-acetylglucosaminyl deacetylase
MTPPALTARARRLAIALLVATAILPGAAPLQAQEPEGNGATALGVALRKLGQTGRVLMIGAHPDDENTALLAELALGHGADVAYLSLTRGEGGQNLIGPELQEALGLIRTEELLAARRMDGARQYFSRAYDFGFSKNAEETFRNWPREELLGDVVETIRRFRPDIIITVFGGTPADGHGHHQAAGMLAREGFRAAADPARYPDQVARGAAPHAARALYHAPFRPVASPTLTVATGDLDPLFGRSRYQIAMQSRSRHRSQDMGRAEPLGPQSSQLVLLDGEAFTAGAASLLAGVDTLLSMRAASAGATPSLITQLAGYERLIASARAAFDPFDTDPLADKLAAAAQILAGLSFEPLQKLLLDERRDVEDALRRAAGIVTDATAAVGSVVPGSALEVTLTAWNGGTRPVGVARMQPLVPHGWAVQPLDEGAHIAEIAPGQLVQRRFRIDVPGDAAAAEPYFLREPRQGAMYTWPDGAVRGEPFEPPDVRAEFTLTTRGADVGVRRTVEQLHVDKAIGELRRPVLVVPRFTVALTPAVRAVPLQAGDAAAFTLQATVTAHGDGEGAAMLNIGAPAGWRIEPAAVPLAFANAGGSSTVRLTVTPPPGQGAVAASIRAWVGNGSGSYDREVQIIDHPHITRRPLYRDATARIRLMDAAIAAGLHVGYIEGAGDDGAAALEQLGAVVTRITPEELAGGDLSRYNAIVSGIRAYEVRPDILAANTRLLDYARAGGTYIAQYNKYEFPEGGFPPYPFTMARPHGRVTDETAAVTLLQPEHPLLSWPNRITAADFEGWVQERGLYFADRFDERYTPLLAMADPGEDALLGSLLAAQVGEGWFVYTGLALFRQWPEAVPGAYRLLANLVSLGSYPAAPNAR